MIEVGAKYTEAQKKATQKYVKEGNLKIVSFRVKEEKRNAYLKLAEVRNESLSSIIQNHLDKDCEASGIPVPGKGSDNT